MGCIVNWDSKNPPPLQSVPLEPNGCIINWLKADADIASANATGCIVNWDAKTDLNALSRTPPNGDGNGCIVNWMGVREDDLRKAGKGGCIIDW